MNRRRLLLAALTAAGVPRAARAGAQIEEPLIDSVRSALSGAIAQAAPPRPRFERIEDRAHAHWLSDLELDLGAHLREVAQVRREGDANRMHAGGEGAHGSVCTSTESTAGRSWAIAVQ